MQDFVSALDQLNTVVFNSYGEIRELLDTLHEEGLTVTFEDSEPLIIQLTDDV